VETAIGAFSGVDASVSLSPTSKQPPKAAVPVIESALCQMEDANGWYFLGAVGKRLLVLMPDFDPRTYGSAKLLSLIERSEAFEVRRENLAVFIKPRPAPAVT